MKPLYGLALLPVIAFFCGGWLSGVAPTFVLGIPFLLFWNVTWMVLTSVVLVIIDRAYPLAPDHESRQGRPQ